MNAILYDFHGEIRKISTIVGWKKCIWSVSTLFVIHPAIFQTHHSAGSEMLNPCHAEYIKMPHPFLLVSQSDYLIQIVDINSHTEWQTVQIQISWLLQKYGNIKHFQHFILFKPAHDKSYNKTIIIQVVPKRYSCSFCWFSLMSQRKTKSTIRLMWPTKTQISHRYIHPVWQGFLFISLSTQYGKGSCLSLFG